MKQEQWDNLYRSERVRLISEGVSAQKAFTRAHRYMAKTFGPRPKGPPKPPLWLRLAAKVAGEGESMKKFWAFLNGKKTLLGVILVSVPVIWGGVEPVLTEAGMSAEKAAAIGGVVLGAVGILHKVMKALGVAEKPPAN